MRVRYQADAHFNQIFYGRSFGVNPRWTSKLHCRRLPGRHDMEVLALAAGEGRVTECTTTRRCHAILPSLLF